MQFRANFLFMSLKNLIKFIQVIFI